MYGSNKWFGLLYSFLHGQWPHIAPLWLKWGNHKCKLAVKVPYKSSKRNMCMCVVAKARQCDRPHGSWGVEGSRGGVQEARWRHDGLKKNPPQRFRTKTQADKKTHAGIQSNSQFCCSPHKHATSPWHTRFSSLSAPLAKKLSVSFQSRRRKEADTKRWTLSQHFQFVRTQSQFWFFISRLFLQSVWNQSAKQD